MIMRILIVLSLAAFALWELFLEPSNPARKCRWQPDAACTCAGVRGAMVYGCECCAASPCRPQADLDLEKTLKSERAKAKAEHDAP